MKTGQERNLEHEQRKKNTGKVRTDYRSWVLAEDKTACEEAMRRAARKFVKRTENS